VSNLCDVIIAIQMLCTVPCFTRSPRWGTGCERDLKQTKQKQKQKHKGAFRDNAKAPNTITTLIIAVYKYEHCNKTKLTSAACCLEFYGVKSSCRYSEVF